MPALAVKVALALIWWLLAAAVVWADQEGGARHKPGMIDLLLIPRMWMTVLFSLIALVVLMRYRVGRRFRLVWLSVVFIVFAVLTALPLGSFARGMGMHPSPVCSITKPFIFAQAGRSIPIVFFVLLGVISVLSIAGNKLFCGWACPLGAAQEIPQRIAMRKKLREKLHIMLPFRVTNTIRALIYVAFLVLLFTAGRNIFAQLNAFEFFHWGFGTAAVITFAVTMIASVFIFRPFCHLACPIGLYTWLLERLSLTKIRLNREGCNMCEACVTLTNCPAVPALLDGKKVTADCHACGQCVTVCPKDALRYG